ncbi:MAG: hypothetical protein K0Q94_6797 [Paenibacillus sp.]|nr:hypothetical protein [Paenibacillus sp.]
MKWSDCWPHESGKARKTFKYDESSGIRTDLSLFCWKKRGLRIAVLVSAFQSYAFDGHIDLCLQERWEKRRMVRQMGRSADGGVSYILTAFAGVSETAIQ